MNLAGRGARFLKRMLELPHKISRIQEALGRIEKRQLQGVAATGVNDAEFRVYSQWGEDGIIQHLLRHVPIANRTFVEFGVESYVESNTRFLLVNDNWSGLVIDGSEDNVGYIRNDAVYWAHNLKAECSFITRENINELIRRNGLTGDIGLLSVDIDGNDYWVWEAIDCISPRIVICEYNSLFGPSAKVTTPYDPSFVRDRAHFSKVYYGASAAALAELAGRKGYCLVAGNSAGNNLFFVRKDLMGSLEALRPEQAYRRGLFREFHDEQGRLTFDDFETRLGKVRHLPLFDLETASVKAMGEIAAISA